MPIKVVILQPVVPHYRVPLFGALAAMPDLDVTVVASRKVPGAPNSVENLPHWADVGHPATAWFHERLFWQSGLRLPPSLGPGDVLVVGGNPRFVNNVRLFWTARRRGVGTVWWNHYHSATSVAWRTHIRYALMRRATVTMLYTDDEVAELKALEPHYPRPVVGLNNTIDTTPIHAAKAHWPAARIEAFKREHGLAARRLLLFCGRLRSNPSTQLDVALKAFKELYSRDPSWHFAIIGGGEEEARYRRLANELGIAAGVRWIGPIYEEENLAPWFLSASYFIYPGPIGLAVIHSFSYGLPVITHGDRPHAPEIAALRHGENGIKFKRGNWNDLVEKIEVAIADPDARRRMGDEALRTATTTYGFDSMVARFAGAIRLASKLSLEAEAAGGQRSAAGHRG